MADVEMTWDNWLSRDMQYYRQPGKEGINVFEAPKETDVAFDGVKVRIGGASTLQFQGLTQDNDSGGLKSLTNNFNLATANLDLDVALAEGVRMHLRTYLSSQHHPEAWVKGGYLQVDSLDFVQEGFLAGLMENVRIKVGHMEINYGDNHFRRTDNADSMYNPFVGNYIMDSFTTEVGAEVYYFCDDFFGMVGVSNGNLNQSSADPGVANEPSYVGKLGYDAQLTEDLRVRLTGSVYASFNSAAQYLYDGDRSGSRYYNVMEGSFRSGRFAPGFDNELVAIMVNPFVKYKGLEIYGVLETVSGAKGDADYSANQYAAEVLYRFGENERFYIGGRYNLVDAELATGEDVEIDRINLGGGWFITDNVLAKIEYVTQSYDGFPEGSIYDGGEFNGIMLEGAISF
ncbi:hypothetical protein DDZ13_11315 [Coraliomargarita sinensis]|uniref:Porin n=2 Tax=Coraliomargarita sinensis TaxID=2174842 RepID=A0A317ZIA8_9BACT|nr:hypothetical protein DDZ13_11315 [Coraliomargarita sinensis]